MRRGERLRRRLAHASYGDWLLLCFLLGTLGGTAAALLFGERGGASFNGGLGTGAEAGEIRQLSGLRFAGVSSFLTVFSCRAAQVLAGWIAGLTVCSRFLFGLFTVWIAMSLAAALALFTVREGAWGLFSFLGAVLPQGFLYVLIWRVLAAWAGAGERRLRPLGTLFLLAAAGVGALLESVSFL